MTMAFPEFVRAYSSGSILEDASWRAYDIAGMVEDTDVAKALKFLGYEHVSSLAVDYGIAHELRAKHLLGLWWVWRSIATGQRRKGLKGVGK